MTIAIKGSQIDNGFLSLFPERWKVGDGVLLSTHCMFPNGDQVVVMVRRDPRGHSILSDNGSAWKALDAAGLDPDQGRILRDAYKHALSHGLSFEAGEFFMRHVEDHLLPGNIIHLANTVQSWVASQISKINHDGNLNLDDRLIMVLEKIYSEKLIGRDLEVPGASTRLYSMSALVSLGNNKVGIFRTVTEHWQSFFACHTAFGDIALAEPKSKRVAVIEQQQNWASSDLALIGQTATHIIDLDRQPDAELRRLAA